MTTHRATSNTALRLDKHNGMIAGLCAGIARYLRVDPTWVRVGTLVAAIFATKLVIIGYLIGWLLLDE
jgi:phage shock protein PspC (stress-responsive transcriptional regulator)